MTQPTHTPAHQFISVLINDYAYSKGVSKDEFITGYLAKNPVYNAAPKLLEALLEAQTALILFHNAGGMKMWAVRENGQVRKNALEVIEKAIAKAEGS